MERCTVWRRTPCMKVHCAVRSAVWRCNPAVGCILERDAPCTEVHPAEEVAVSGGVARGSAVDTVVLGTQSLVRNSCANIGAV